MRATITRLAIACGFTLIPHMATVKRTARKVIRLCDGLWSCPIEWPSESVIDRKALGRTHRSVVSPTATNLAPRPSVPVAARLKIGSYLRETCLLSRCDLREYTTLVELIVCNDRKRPSSPGYG